MHGFLSFPVYYALLYACTDSGQFYQCRNFGNPDMRMRILRSFSWHGGREATEFLSFKFK